jgi:hypothetical protein
MGDTAFQFIGYRIVKRADFGERQLLSHVVSLLLAVLRDKRPVGGRPTNTLVEAAKATPVTGSGGFV